MAKPIDPRTLFPRACTGCSIPKPADEFGEAKGRKRRWCKGCEHDYWTTWYSERSEERVDYSRAWREQNPEHYRDWHADYYQREKQRLDAENERRAQQVYAATRPKARKHKQEWTSADLEVAARKDLTIEQVALALGRTNHAVVAKRTLINARDPRTLSKLGYDPNKQED